MDDETAWQAGKGRSQPCTSAPCVLQSGPLRKDKQHCCRLQSAIEEGTLLGMPWMSIEPLDICGSKVVKSDTVRDWGKPHPQPPHDTIEALISNIRQMEFAPYPHFPILFVRAGLACRSVPSSPLLRWIKCKGAPYLSVSLAQENCPRHSALSYRQHLPSAKDMAHDKDDQLTRTSTLSSTTFSEGTVGRPVLPFGWAAHRGTARGRIVQGRFRRFRFTKKKHDTHSHTNAHRSYLAESSG